MGIENPVHLIFIAAVALIVLGPKRLPDLAKALGQGIREFREAMSEGEEERHLANQARAAAATAQAPPPPEVSTEESPDAAEPVPPAATAPVPTAPPAEPPPGAAATAQAPPAAGDRGPTEADLGLS